MHDALITRIESAIRRDPARRGILSGELGRGFLQPAAASLVQVRGAVAIVTGFPVKTESGLFAETDGPPGAVLLAEVLSKIGWRVVLVTDEPCESALRHASESAGLDPDLVAAAPVDPQAAARWIEEFLRRHPDLSHLIAIERPGPCHTTDSVDAQGAGRESVLREFAHRLPSERRDHSHNMRGERIDDMIAPLHRLFEEAARRQPHLQTIGIGDGGNEIGMGTFRWEELAKRLSGRARGWIPCRIPTDWTIVCGVSNWGGWGLGAAVALLASRAELVTAWSESRQRRLLQELVRNGPAVDGVSRMPTATVDGLSDDDYFQPWREIFAQIAADR